MTPKDFSAALRKSASLIGHGDAANLHALAAMFDLSTSATVAATIKRLARAGLAPARANPRIGQLLAELAPVQDFLQVYGKPAVAKDMQTLSEFLGSFTDAGVRPFVDAAVAALTAVAPPAPVLKVEVVQRHLHRLEQSIGDSSAFTAAYNDLEHDPDVGKLEIAELAKRFTERAIKSRPAALKKIWARHNAQMVFKAKSESRAGRSAA